MIAWEAWGNDFKDAVGIDNPNPSGDSSGTAPGQDVLDALVAQALKEGGVLEIETPWGKTFLGKMWSLKGKGIEPVWNPNPGEFAYESGIGGGASGGLALNGGSIQEQIDRLFGHNGINLVRRGHLADELLELGDLLGAEDGLDLLLSLYGKGTGMVSPLTTISVGLPQVKREAKRLEIRVHILDLRRLRRGSGIRRNLSGRPPRSHFSE